MTTSFINRYCSQAAEVARSLTEQEEELLSIVDTLEKVCKQGGRIYTCGNGGSACDAMHFAEELVARYLRERPGIPAQHLIDSGTMTCWANDYDFSSVFSRQVETLMTSKDAFVGFTTSGNSENIIKAVAASQKIGGATVVLCGKDGGKLQSYELDHFIIVKSQLTSHIQEAHMIIVHLLCDLLEQRLYPDAK